MAPAKYNKNQVGLGRAIINQKAKEARQPRESHLYSTDGDTSGRYQSVTQERNLDEFLNSAQLAGTDFTAEKQNITIIQSPAAAASSALNPFLLSPDQESATLRRHQELKSSLRVPRRPPWTRNLTAAQLEKQEREAFLEWRRALALVQEREDLVFTPFERNLEVWRQLWRVLERSHLVVQIVDARNPLCFRCEDLEAYVTSLDSTREGSGQRRNLLLINKSDLLTREQRRQWADHLDAQGVKYAFYSAAQANALQEAARLSAPVQHQAVPEALPSQLDDSSGDEDLANAAVGLKDVKVEAPKSPSNDDDTLDSNEEDEDDGESDADSATDSGSETGHYHSIDEDEAADEADSRIRVLSVHELEKLFMDLGPNLSDFADDTGKAPPRLVVGLVGYPNVGKSSTINSLIGEKKVSVSSTPGKTKHFQTIHLSDDIILCDCPGLVFPQFATTRADLVCDGVLPIDQLREYTAPVALVTRRMPREILEAAYGLTIRIPGPEERKSNAVTAEDLLIAYAVARGFTRAGQGNPDEARAARYILKDYVNAKLLFCHAPPGVDEDAFNAQQRALALDRLSTSSRKRAPATRVGKDADTFIESTATPKGNAVDRAFFAGGLAPRPFVQGSVRNGQSFSRSRLYPHQNTVTNDGTEVGSRRARIAAVIAAAGGDPSERSKHHNKGNKRQKQRSGKGYD